MNDDIHALSGAYAVDALDDVERARFERHLASCPTCQTEVAGLREAAAELSSLSVQAPPSALRQRVLHDITTVRPLPPQLPGSSTPTMAPDAPSGTSRVRRPGGPPSGDASSSPRRWRLLVAAAAAAVLTIGGLAVWRSTSPAPPAESVASQVLEAPDASRLVKTLPGGARATIVRSPSLGKAVIVASGMPAPPAGRVYQLWLQEPSGRMAPAGFMPAAARTGEEQVALLNGNAATATGAGVTVEPVGGSAQPTSAPVMLFTFS